MIFVVSQQLLQYIAEKGLQYLHKLSNFSIGWRDVRNTDTFNYRNNQKQNNATSPYIFHRATSVAGSLHQSYFWKLM